MSELTTRELMDRVARLETAMQELTLKLQKETRNNADLDRLNTELRRLIEKDVIDAFDRIKNIELKFFPNLARDISQLNSIIGEGDGKAWNPLDRRGVG